jgi:hypothetical protein
MEEPARLCRDISLKNYWEQQHGLSTDITYSSENGFVMALRGYVKDFVGSVLNTTSKAKSRMIVKQIQIMVSNLDTMI